MKLEFLMTVCPAVKAGYEERAGEKDFKGIHEERCEEACEVALGSSMDAPVSTEYAGYGWSNPLLDH